MFVDFRLYKKHNPIIIYSPNFFVLLSPRGREALSEPAIHCRILNFLRVHQEFYFWPVYVSRRFVVCIMKLKLIHWLFSQLRSTASNFKLFHMASRCSYDI